MKVAAPSACLVVGAGDGLGIAIARAFGALGHPVALVARNASALEHRAERLRAEGMIAVAAASDLSEPGGGSRTVATVRDLIGPIGILVFNAAALGPPARPLDLERSGLLRSLEVNVISALEYVQEVVPDMGAGGTILFTNGTWAVEPSPTFTALGLAKAAQRNLALSLAADLEPVGIHVATVCVTGAIEAGGAHDPQVLAGSYVALHAEPKGAWQRELSL